MNNQNNSLLNNFYNHNRQQIPFQQNNLLRNNPIIGNNFNRQNNQQYNNQQYNNSQQIQQMKMYQMQQQMAKMKMLQEVKKKEKEILKNLSKINNSTKKDITELIIKPENNKLTKEELEQIDVNYKEMENKFGNEDNYKKNLQKYWDKRTNQPYKNILKEEDYTKSFKEKDDLIVHKVTDLDKDEEKLEMEFKEKDEDREKHDGELKAIYTLSKKAENKKKFEYNNVYKFRFKYDPKDHDSNKQDKMEYYKKQQKKLDKENKRFNEAIESLVNSNIYSKEQLQSLGITTNERDNSIDINFDKMDEISQQLDSINKEEDNNNINNEKKREIVNKPEVSNTSDTNIKKKATARRRTIKF